MDATAVKVEIKTWEHEFRAQHGRSATIEDVKALPNIAEKYKLYKKLTKEAEQEKGKAKERLAQVLEPPQTPPREGRRRRLSSDAPSAVILPKSRPIASSSNLETKNPFSPVKKAKSNKASINPFITPVKRKSTPSPDLFLPVQDVTARQNAAIVKARKRLRGESVSPSPLPRDKRRRANGLDPPVHDRHSRERSISPPNGNVAEGDSFVDDSPVKAPAGVKAFTPLFEEAMPLSQATHSKPGNLTTRGRAFSRAKTLPSNLFGVVKKEIKDVHDERAGRHGTPDLFSKNTDANNSRTSKMHSNEKGTGMEQRRTLDGAQKAKKGLPGPKGLIPSRDDLFEDPSSAASSSIAAGASRKRPLSKVVEHDKHESQDKRLASNLGNLLPPSPPPQQDDAGRYNPKGKGKGKARDTGQKKNKKRKLSAADEQDDEDEDATSSDGVEVKVVAWHGGPHSPQLKETDFTLTVDPELQRIHVRTEMMDVRARSASPSLEKFEVDLPEEMRRVLAISPHDGREREEEDLVKGVMRGRRTVRGEVWAPGEIGDESEGSDEGIIRVAEDDWEGEGVPWEVAEL